MSDPAIVFADKAFCFTGKLAELKRSSAEREVRARGGQTTDVINERLDVLVVGDTASPGWKFGEYGRKIEAARLLVQKGARRPRLVSESAFMTALALCSPVNAGTIDGKVVVCSHKFILDGAASAFNNDHFERTLSELATQYGCHVTTRASVARFHSDLFGDVHPAPHGDALVVETRFVRHQRLDEPVMPFLGAVERAMETEPGVDGRLRWFERTEGSSDYIRLLREVPSSLRVPGL